MTNRTVESSQQFHARLDLLKDADRKHARGCSRRFRWFVNVLNRRLLGNSN
jgi:hypothetical protein